MKKKFTVVMIAIFTFVFCCNVSFAAEKKADDHKWIKIVVGLPDNVVFDHNVVIDIKNSKTGETKSYTIEEADDYIGYFEISKGTYSIVSAKVVGEYEGTFKCGYSKDAFKITASSEKTTEVPVIVDHFASFHEAKEEAEDYSGMSFDEAMAEVNKNPPEITDLGEDEYEYGDSTEDEEINTDSAEEAARTKALKESTTKRGMNILSSLGITVIALGGLVLVFYVLKKIRDR